MVAEAVSYLTVYLLGALTMLLCISVVIDVVDSETEKEEKNKDEKDR